MHDVVRLARFYRAVPPLPPLLVGTFWVVGIASALTIAADAARARAAFAPVLFLQLFATSSGFAVAARRGYYDLLLTRDHRLAIALAHWSMSVTPGVATWLALAGVETVTTGGMAPRALLTSGTMASMALVSTVPWALTVALPRFSGAIGWLLLVLVAAAVFPVAPAIAWMSVALDSPWSASGALAVMVWPAALVGRQLTPAGWLMLLPAILVAGTLMLGACVWICRADYPLQASQ